MGKELALPTFQAYYKFLEQQGKQVHTLNYSNVEGQILRTLD